MQYIITGHSADESINFTGTDNQTHNKHKEIHNAKTNLETKKLAQVKKKI